MPSPHQQTVEDYCDAWAARSGIVKVVQNTKVYPMLLAIDCGRAALAARYAADALHGLRESLWAAENGWTDRA